MPPKETRNEAIIPQNFVDTGTVLGGEIRLRNAVEAAFLALGTAIPVFYLPLTLHLRIILCIVVSVPLAVFGVVGIGGDSLTEFAAHWLRFVRRRRVVTATPEGNRDVNRKRHLHFIDRRKYHVVYYEDETEIPAGAAAIPRKNDTPGRLIRSQTLYDLIPISRIQNGILQTTDGRYLKILEIEPINFMLRSPQEQHNVIYSFASVLKIAPVRMQFKSFSRKADVNSYLDKLRQDARSEKDLRLWSIHKDYLRFVRQLGSRDTVSRRFFVIFQYEAPTNERNTPYSEIVSTLETTANSFRTYLGQCGNQVVEHTSEDEFLTEVFYSLLNRRSCVARPLQDRIQNVLSCYMAQGDATRLEDIPANAFLIPPSVDFRHGKYVCMDGVYHSYLMIPSDGYRTRVVAGWLSLLVNAGEGIDVDFFLERQPKERMVQKIGQQIRINRSKIKDTSDTNTDFDDLAGAIQSGYYLKEGLANGEDFYYAAILVTVTASSVRDLEWRVGELRKLCISQDMDLQVCSFRQEAAFLSSLPLCAPDKDLLKKYRRNMLTSSAASCYPFLSYELCDRNGILLGVNKFNNSLVSLDSFDTRTYKNANIAVIGTSGAGKTFTTQLIAKRMRLAGIPVYTIAPLKGHEFYRQCKALNGTFIQISPASRQCINVMEIRKSDRTSAELLDGPGMEHSELAAKIQKLHVFFSLLIPDLSNEEKQLLDEAIIQTYQAKGITHDNATLEDPARPGQYREMPVLGDLHAILLQSRATRRMANILNRMVNGSASNFNQQTNVDLDNPYVVIDISELSGDLLPVGMFVGLDYLWDKAKEDRTTRKQIIIDEVWQIIGAGSSALAADYVFEMVKIIRGYGGGVLVATQDISDFFALENGKYGRGILNNSNIKIILNLEDEEARRVQDVLKLTDAEIGSITRFGRGEALISTHSNNVAVSIRCSELEKDLITTDRDELRRIVERRRAGQPFHEETEEPL